MSRKKNRREPGRVKRLVIPIGGTLKPPPSYAPVYAAALYPDLAKIAKIHGYALAVHGSLQRDFDLIAIPWAEKPSDPEYMLKSITETFAMQVIGDSTNKLHGRKAWSLSIGHGECAIDLSFMPFGRPKLIKPTPPRYDKAYFDFVEHLDTEG